MASKPRGSDKANVRRPSTLTPANETPKQSAVKPPVQDQPQESGAVKYTEAPTDEQLKADMEIPDKQKADLAFGFQDSGEKIMDPNNVYVTNAVDSDSSTDEQDNAESRRLVREGRSSLSAQYQPHEDPDLKAVGRG